MQLMKAISSDRIGGLIWMAFGIAVVYGSWTMDRLQSLGIPPATAPGVVPGLIGLGIIIFGSILLIRRGRASADATEPIPAPADATAPLETAPQAVHRDELDWKRVLLSWVLCMTYGGVLLGVGAPYWVLTAAFLFLHILLLDETGRVPAAPTRRRLLIAAIVAPVAATLVMLTFERIFLVRLP
jgi:hypothetical protein